MICFKKRHIFTLYYLNGKLRSAAQADFDRSAAQRSRILSCACIRSSLKLRISDWCSSLRINDEKILVNKITLFSMASSSDHNSVKPRSRARRPIYTWPSTHEESEYLIETQKFFAPFSLLLRSFLYYNYIHINDVWIK